MKSKQVLHNNTEYVYLNNKHSVKNDGNIMIATGKSRKDLSWRNEEILWSKLAEKLSQPIRTSESYSEFLNLDKAEQDNIKDVGGFVGGTLIEGRRKSENLIDRQLITLDVDFAPRDFWDVVKSKLKNCCLIHSTHKHCNDNPRYRLIIPLKTKITPDEYEVVSRKIAEEIGIDFFDTTTFEPHRLMYWGSAARDGDYIFEYVDTAWLDPREVLAKHETGKNTSVKMCNDKPKQLTDPKEKKGVIGAFCKAYNIFGAIDEFLHEIYVVAKDKPNRYTYTQGTAGKGLFVYKTGDHAYSHHSTDPAGRKAHNSFDLVRIHKFGHLDTTANEETNILDLPSQKRMMDLALNDKKVKSHMEADENKNVNSWKKKLATDNKGILKRTLTNLILILKNDPALISIFYDEFREGIDVEGEVPWKRLKGGWNKTDQVSIASYVDNNYNLYSKEKLSDAILSVALDRSKHPIRDYLNNLPKWDGIQRVDTLIIKYLGADDNEYVRATIRKALVAAISRVMKPGIKFDTVLVLNGPQGIGKSTLIAKLGGKYYSDSLSISDTRDKTAAEKLQGYWIIEIGELAGMSTVDAETLKSFLSRQDDKYRASYGYSVEDHPRQCIIMGTTNNESGFLKDVTGARRYWPVRVSGNSDSKPWDLGQAEIDQIWAEALKIYHEGETLILTGEADKLSKEAQIEAFESDDREGLVREYLNIRLPHDWHKLSLETRRERINELMAKGNYYDSPKKEVCVMEIWCELFGKEKSDLKRQDSYTINSIMQKIESYERYKGNKNGTLHFQIYGKQRAYVLKDTEQQEQE